MAESWSKDLAFLAEKGGIDLDNLVRGVKLELFTKIIRRTRVDTGRLRGNWQLQEERKPEGTVDRVIKSDSEAQASINAQKITADGVTYYVNNLEYAKPREDADGMVKRTVAEARTALKKRVARVRAGGK